MINIQDLIPFMKDVYVAMDECGKWFWFKHKPHRIGAVWVREKIEHQWGDLSCFDIAPADDWTKSLIKVGGNDEKSGF